MFEDYQKTIVKATLQIDKNPLGILFPEGRALASTSLESFEDVETPDLAFVKFILASEHENANGDYFARSELLKAYRTPRHKPFNIEHTIEEAASYISSPLFNDTKNTIVGHIVGSALATKDGTILTDEEVDALDATDNADRPHAESLDLVATAVLYKFYFPETVGDIERMAEDGDIAVSMECFFKGNDFMVDSDIVDMTDANKRELTNDWHNGKVVGGRRVSRVLRDVLFGGVAGTENPANQESVFLTANMNKELARLKTRHDELHILYDVEPRDEYITEHENVTRVAASLSSKLQQK